MAGWNVTFTPPREDLFDGITIEYSAGVSEFSGPLHRAVLALIAELGKQGIETKPGRWGTGHVIDPEMPTDAMQIRVGMKPIPLFMQQRLEQVPQTGRGTIFRGGPALPKDAR
jgi:hypothetical protein